MHRPDVLQRVRAAAAARRRVAGLHPAPARVTDRLHRSTREDQRRVQRRDPPVCPRPAGAVGGVRQGPTQRRRDARAPGPLRPGGGGAVHRAGAGEDPGVSHRAPPRRGRRLLPMDRAHHRGGQPVLRLRRRPGFRAVLPEVQLLLPLQRQAVPQRARMGQTPSLPGRDRAHRAGQRVRHHHRPGRCRTGAGHLRSARPGADRRATTQVAGHPAAPVQRGRPGGRLPLPGVDPAGRVLPDPGAGPAGVRAGVLRAGHPGQPRRRPTRPGQPDLRPPAQSAAGRGPPRGASAPG